MQGKLQKHETYWAVDGLGGEDIKASRPYPFPCARLCSWRARVCTLGCGDVSRGRRGMDASSCSSVIGGTRLMKLGPGGEACEAFKSPPGMPNGCTMVSLVAPRLASLSQKSSSRAGCCPVRCKVLCCGTNFFFGGGL